jgi:hypothetical protein
MSLGVLGGAIIIWVCLTKGTLVFGLLALAGSALGYLTGVLVVPLSSNESERFTVYAKVISGFVTGYLLSKLDPVVTAMLAVDQNTGVSRITQPEVAAHFLITLCSYLITLLTVFNVRAYWVGDSGNHSVEPK